MVSIVEQDVVLPEHMAQWIEKAVLAALEAEGRAGEISVAVVGDGLMRRMNHEYRGIDRSTDVLSFPSAEGEGILSEPDGFLGDIAISLDAVYRQAREYGHSPEREIAFLTVHGVLHILGYDHMSGEQEQEMLLRQKFILEGMQIQR
ncbi:MAG: rRNA maturation RNase YbeY [Bacillota bacterium]